MSITAVQSTTFQTVQSPEQKKSTPEKQQQTQTIASSFDQLKLGERLTDTSVKELVMGSFMGGIFGAGLSIPAAGIAESLVPRNANMLPVLFSGAIGATAAGLTTDNPLNGAAIGAGTAGTIGTLVGAVAGGPKAALAMGIASALGGAVGGGIGSITRGRMISQPPSHSMGMGMVLKGMAHSRR